MFPPLVYYVLIGTILSLSGFLIYATRKYEAAKRELVYYKHLVQRHQRINLVKQGCDVKHGEYDLRSYDGGLIWYAVEVTPEGLKILGKADEVFPGFISEQEGMANLIRYVTEHGPLFSPLSFEGETAEHERRLLEDAGFQVVIT